MRLIIDDDSEVADRDVAEDDYERCQGRPGNWNEKSDVSFLVKSALLKSNKLLLKDEIKRV